MRASVESFESGWSSVSIELSTGEIDSLIEALEQLKRDQDHFHYRSTFEGEPCVGDIEVSCSGDTEFKNLVLDPTPPTCPDRTGT